MIHCFLAENIIGACTIYAKYVAKNSVLQNENLEILTKKTDTIDNKYL